jgi:inhibitor of cysteine peptidase
MSEFIKSPFGKFIVSFFAVIIGLIAVVSTVQLGRRNQNGGVASNYEQFRSCRDLNDYIFKDRVGYGYPYYLDKSFRDNVVQAPTENVGMEAGGTTTGGGSVDFSETNIQVEGVDESDIIKTDGSYIYLVRGNSVLVFDATNPTESNKLAQIEVPGNPIEMFLHNDQLIVLAGTGNYYGGYYGNSFDRTSWPMQSSQNGIFVYDVSNPSNPDLQREVKIEGDYKTARLTDDTVYLITHKNIAYGSEDAGEIESTIPRYSNSDIPGQTNYVQAADCTEISRFGEDVYNYVSVVALDTRTGDSDVSVLVGNAANVYVSRSNIYLATTRYEYPDRPVPMPRPIVPFTQSQTDIAFAPDYHEPQIYTDVFKLEMNGTSINFKAETFVPGTIINQFSMDEFDGNFRIATNTLQTGSWDESMSNYVYILNQDLKRIGSIEGIAPGERIYSTRFLGDKLYMVTFKTVDPFFVIDLSIPTNPKILGELKIPGYSDYLHPYDENHVIGFGKNAEAVGINAVRPTGLKIALFDVRDVKNPLLKSEISFGSNYSDSEILYNHKALLFDRERELLVIPASFDISSSETTVSESFNGFISMKINLAEGFSERGRINDSSYDNYYYGYGSKRSLFIDSFLFATLGDGLGVFEIETMELVKKISYE